MHILFTDSGVGGLSVCAYAEAFLRTHGTAEPMRLTYVNASAENKFGYNALSLKQEKLEHFDHFLHIIAEKYAPDLICIACNTLSVLLHDTRFFAEGKIPVQGIVETGVNRLLRSLAARPGLELILFGTVTTIEAQTYPTMLIEHGVGAQHITSRACPELADIISEDYEGHKAARSIGTHVRAALAKLQKPVDSCLAYLACTHYGYRKELFIQAFEQAGVQAQVLNPNEFFIDDLLTDGGEGSPESAIEVEFVARYRIPETALRTISFFLGEISPRTVRALRNYTYAPDLFPGFRPSGQAS